MHHINDILTVVINIPVVVGLIGFAVLEDLDVVVLEAVVVVVDPEVVNVGAFYLQ